MHKKNIINLLVIQEKLVKNIQRGQNFINIYVETNPKVHICPCCKSKTKYVHDYHTQKIQHISIGHIESHIILKKRRYVCHTCSKRFYEHYDFLQKNFRKSNILFHNVVDDLKQLKH